MSRVSERGELDIKMVQNWKVKRVETKVRVWVLIRESEPERGSHAVCELSD